MEIEDKLLIGLLEKIINYSRIDPELGFYYTKEQAGIIRNMKLEIFPNDHKPPHFHVKSNDKSIDAKFLLASGKFLSGTISSRDERAIEEFYSNPQVKKRLFEVWEKFHGAE